MRHLIIKNGKLFGANVGKEKYTNKNLYSFYNDWRIEMKTLQDNKILIQFRMSAMVFLFFSYYCLNLSSSAIANLPKAKKIRKEISIHNTIRIDNYYWLQDRLDPNVIQYIQEENNYTEKRLKHSALLQKSIKRELKEYLHEPNLMVPVQSRGYYYYTRYNKNQSFPVQYRKKGSLDLSEEVILDINTLAVERPQFSVTPFYSSSISPNNRFFAYGIDMNGSEFYTLRIRDLQEKKDLADEIPDTMPLPYCWGNDNRTIFYVAREKNSQSRRIRKHIVGTAAESDTDVFYEKDITLFTYITRTNSNRFLIINSSNTQGVQECQILDTENPNGVLKTFQSREDGLIYTVDHIGDFFYILTNWKAPNFRIMRTSIGETGMAHWQEMMPESGNVTLSEITAFNNHLLIKEETDGLIRYRIFDLRSGKSSCIKFPDSIYEVNAPYGQGYDSDRVFFSYSSLNTPPATLAIDLDDGKIMVIEKMKFKGFDPKDFISERIFTKAPDGTRIPVSLVYHKDLKRNGKNPLLLTGYGHYGISLPTCFDPSKITLLKRGFIIALAHVRGGREMGVKWHEAGRLLNKKSSYEDFIACAEYLINNEYTSRKALFSYGYSAGGLLVAVAANMRPDLFKGVIAHAPVIDLVNRLTDTSLPVSTISYNEFGDPSQERYYKYVASFSPYDNAERKDYPAILAVGSINDSRTLFWEPVKWVAKLRDMKTDSNNLLLHISMDGGHAKSSNRFGRIEEMVIIYTFICNLAEINR